MNLPLLPLHRNKKRKRFLHPKKMKLKRHPFVSTPMILILDRTTNIAGWPSPLHPSPSPRIPPMSMSVAPKESKTNTEDPHSTKPPENKSRSVGARVGQQVKSKSNGKDPSLNSKMMGLPLQVPGLSEDVIKRGLELMGASKRAELDKRWKDLQLAELELNAKCAQLISHQAKLIWEAYNSSSTH